MRISTSYGPNAYEKILNRSSAPERAKTILYALVASVRPLSVGDRSMVMAVHEACQVSAEIEDYLESEEGFRRALRDFCGLVMVILSHIYLLHQTARKFSVKPGSDVPVDKTSPTTWKGSISPEGSRTYINSALFRKTNDELSSQIGYSTPTN